MTTRALLLENIHPDASARLAKEGYQVDTLARALGRGRADRGHRRRATCSASGPRPRSPSASWTRRPDLVGDRRLLHRHQPDRPGRRGRARRRGVQRAVLQHPQRGRAGAGRDHRADPAADGEERRRCTRACGTSPPTAATRCAAARSASSATATSAPSCRCSPRTSAWPCTSTTPPTSSRSATRAAAPPSTSCSSRADVVTLHVDGRAGNSGFFGADAVRRDAAAAACS